MRGVNRNVDSIFIEAHSEAGSMLSAVNRGPVGAESVTGASEAPTPEVESQAPDGQTVSIGADGSGAGAIDPDQLEDLRGLFGAEAFAELLVKFGNDLRRRLQTIEGQPSRAEVASTAHAMISSAGSLGFMAFSDLCRSVEGVAQSDNDMGPSIAAFATGANLVLRTIQSLAKSS